jgi:hypothetical protein
MSDRKLDCLKSRIKIKLAKLSHNDFSSQTAVASFPAPPP